MVTKESSKRQAPGQVELVCYAPRPLARLPPSVCPSPPKRRQLVLNHQKVPLLQHFHAELGFWI